MLILSGSAHRSQADLGNSYSSVKDSLRAVSYTHLDVYKRQAQGFAYTPEGKRERVRQCRLW